jgi:hypothetical protein
VKKKDAAVNRKGGKNKTVKKRKVKQGRTVRKQIQERQLCTKQFEWERRGERKVVGRVLNLIICHLMRKKTHFSGVL